MRVGEMVKEICEEKNIKVKELAEFLNISQSALSQFFSGTILLKEENMNNVIKKLELTKDEEFELLKAYSLDRISPEIAEYFEKIEKGKNKEKEGINVKKLHKTVGKKIKKVMKQKNMSQKELSAKIDMLDSTISRSFRLLSEGRGISTETLFKILLALNIDIEKIFK